jgi:surfactin synthase thioesterase subunit
MLPEVLREPQVLETLGHILLLKVTREGQRQHLQITGLVVVAVLMPQQEQDQTERQQRAETAVLVQQIASLVLA